LGPKGDACSTNAISNDFCFQRVFDKMICFLPAEKETYMIQFENILTLCIVKNDAKVSPLIEKSFTPLSWTKANKKITVF